MPRRSNTGIEAVENVLPPWQIRAERVMPQRDDFDCWVRRIQLSARADHLGSRGSQNDRPLVSRDDPSIKVHLPLTGTDAPSVHHTGRYKANFTRGGLMVPESRVIADLLLAGVDAAGWQQAIRVDNLLAKRSVSTAVTKASLIRARLKTLPPALWGVIRDGSKPAATHAVLAGVVNYSPLLGDFLDLVVRDLYRRFEPVLKSQHWDAYVEDCRARDATMPSWTQSTE